MRVKKGSSPKKKRWVSVQDAGLYDPKAADTPGKVRITTYLDSDILEFYKNRSVQLGIPYQTLLNSELKRAMSPEEKGPNKEEIRQIIREELEKAS